MLCLGNGSTIALSRGGPRSYRSNSCPKTVMISAIDALAAAGWHTPTTSTGQYQVIAPNRLKITEELGSTVVDYHVDGTRLVLSGDGLERLLGKTEPPQVLDETSQ